MNRLKILKDQIIPLNIIKETENEPYFEINYNQLSYENIIESLRGKESKYLNEKGTIVLYEKDQNYLSSLKTKIYKKNNVYFINTENEKEDQKIYIEDLNNEMNLIVFGKLIIDNESFGVHGFLIKIKNLKNEKRIKYGKMKENEKYSWMIFNHYEIESFNNSFLFSKNENLNNYLINKDDASFFNYLKNNKEMIEIQFFNSLIYLKLNYLKDSLKYYDLILNKIEIKYFKQQNILINNEEKELKLIELRLYQMNYFLFKSKLEIFNELFQFLFKEMIKNNEIHQDYIITLSCSLKSYIQKNIELDLKYFLNISLENNINFSLFEIENNNLLYQISSHHLIKNYLKSDENESFNFFEMNIQEIEEIEEEQRFNFKMIRNYFKSSLNQPSQKQEDIFENVNVIKNIFKKRKLKKLKECLIDLQTSDNDQFKSWNENSNELNFISIYWIEEIIVQYLLNNEERDLNDYYKLFIVNLILNDYFNFFDSDEKIKK
eukprot:gene4777-8363_t